MNQERNELRIGGAGAPSRRRVVQAAAWSVPVVAVAASAPAAAASPIPCVPENLVLNFGVHYNRTNAYAGTATIPTGQGAISVILTSSFGDLVSPNTTSGGESNISVGGPNLGQYGGTTGLKLSNTRTNASNDGDSWDPAYAQRLYFNFSTAIENIRFSVSDIDRGILQNGQLSWSDQVLVEAPGVQSHVGPSGANLTVGAEGHVYSTVNNDAWVLQGPAHTADFYIPGPISTFAVNFANPGSANATSGVLMRAIFFDLCRTGGGSGGSFD